MGVRRARPGPGVSCIIVLTAADLWCLPLQVEQEDFVMEGHGKTPPPGEESKQ